MSDFIESQCEEEYSQSNNSDWDGPDTDQMNESDAAMINDDSGSEVGQMNHHDLDRALELLGEEQLNPRKLAKNKRNPNSMKVDVARLKDRVKKRKIIVSDDDDDDDDDESSIAADTMDIPDEAIAPIDKKPAKLNGSRRKANNDKSIVSRFNNALSKSESNSSLSNANGKVRNINDHFIEVGQVFEVRRRRYIVIFRGEAAPVAKNNKNVYEYNINACFISNYCTVKDKSTGDYQLWLMSHNIPPTMVTKVIARKIEKKSNNEAARIVKALELDNKELAADGTFKRLILPSSYFADIKKEHNGGNKKSIENLPEIWKKFNDNGERMMSVALKNRLAVDKPSLVEAMQIFLPNAEDVDDWKQSNPKNMYQKLVEMHGIDNIEWFMRMWALCSSTGRSIVLDYVSSLNTNNNINLDLITTNVKKECVNTKVKKECVDTKVKKEIL